MPPRPVQPDVDVHQRTSEALDVFKDCDICPEMVVVPAGSFTMGSAEYESDPRNNQGPQHEVAIARAFAIGKYEVTFNEWDSCLADGKCRGHYPLDHGWGRGRHPVIMVSWDDAKAYTEWLAMKTGERYRLPTEAEWEYAARANTFSPYASAGGISTNHANFGPGITKTAEVGLFPANAWGLHDMQGNVWEWVEDDWHPTYDGAPPDGSVWSGGTATQNRVLRGGGWDSAQTEFSLFSRMSNRFDVRNANTGFRIAKGIQ